MTIEEIWRKKNDKQIEIASREIADYSEKVQQIIRAEILRRGMLQPPLNTTVSKIPPHLPKLKYASSLDRFLAYFTDTVIVSTLHIAIIYGFILLNIKPIEESIFLLTIVINTLLDWLYYALLESSPKQGTLGKQAFQIVVTDSKGNRISFVRSTLRFYTRFLTSLTLGIGYIMILFTQKHQALHDLFADTIVIQKSSSGRRRQSP